MHKGNTVPPRLHRYQASKHLHFLTFSCQDRLPYLKSPDSKAVFESVLESRQSQYGFSIHGYVIMPGHVHLLVSEPPIEPLSKAIASLKRRFPGCRRSLLSGFLATTISMSSRKARRSRSCGTCIGIRLRAA